MIFVSIILTCYKQEKFVEETILSVINQRYKNRELLIGDDSPDDNCRRIILKYIKKYPDKIRAWHHNPNKGIVNNMQFLIEHRNKESEYIAFLEGDDSLFPEYLEKKLEIFSKNPDVQLVYNELTTIDEEGKVIEKVYLKRRVKCFYKKGKISYNKLINETIYASRSTLMIRSDNVDKYKILPNFLGDRTIISDIYFFNQIAHNEDIYGIEESLTYYRFHKKSLSKDIQGSIEISLELIKYMNYLCEQGFIGGKYYKNQVCVRYLIIAIFGIKGTLTLGFFRSLKFFLVECIYYIKNKCRNIIRLF